MMDNYGIETFFCPWCSIESSMSLSLLYSGERELYCTGNKGVFSAFAV